MQRGILPLFAVLFGAGGFLGSVQLPADTSTQPSLNALGKAGEWSDVVDGLRGRLVIEGPSHLEAEDDFGIYLEIQNVSNPAKSKNVSFSVDYSIGWQLSDETGKPAEMLPLTILAPIDAPVWITIPGNSTKRWFVSGGLYATQDGEQRLGMRYLLWKISSAKSTRYYLGARFHNGVMEHLISPKPPIDPGPRANLWKGELVLPRVSVPRNRHD